MPGERELSYRRGAAQDAEEKRKGEQEREWSKPRIEDATVKSLKLAQRLQCLGYKKSAERSAAEVATPGRRKE